MDPAALLDGLTASQRTAVASEAAPLCILAGAGAGKTRALTRRIAYRVATGTADPGHVLALTFTRKAAGELSERLCALGVRDRVTTGTFHAVAYAQLRRWWADRGQSAPALLDRKSRLLARLVPGRPGLDGTTIGELAAEIEWAQARLVSPTGYARAASAAGRRPAAAASASADAIGALYDRYVMEKQRRGLVDFDDLLARCAAALETDAGFAAAQRWRWRHLFVDEFQDVNPLQYRLLVAWLGASRDLCVVGDPNQAIYGWNGADPQLLTGLAGRWPGAEVVRLDDNHRCPPQVVEAAVAALGLAPGSVGSTRPDGPPVAVRSYATDRAEAEGVAAELRQARAGGLAWSHLAVLMRTNAQAPAFEAACRMAAIPCRVVGTTSILDQPSVKAAMAELDRQPGAPLAAVVVDLVEQAGEAAAGEGRSGLEALVAAARDLLRLDRSASAGAFKAWLEAAVRADRTESSGPADAVIIGTFHRAKGLEWPAVWVTGLERGLVPIGHATTPEANAEERRLLYVALTRAERELHCSWAEHRRFGDRQVPREASPWLAAIAGTRRPLEVVPGTVWRDRFAAERDRLAAAGRGSLGRRPAPRRGGRPVADGWDQVGRTQDGAVLEALMAWRGAAARAAGVPPHVLFPDVTLAALAAARPASDEELLAVPGLGPVKASRYGPTLLALVAQHRASA